MLLVTVNGKSSYRVTIYILSIYNFLLLQTKTILEREVFTSVLGQTMLKVPCITQYKSIGVTCNMLQVI